LESINVKEAIRVYGLVECETPPFIDLDSNIIFTERCATILDDHNDKRFVAPFPKDFPDGSNKIDVSIDGL